MAHITSMPDEDSPMVGSSSRMETAKIKKNLYLVSLSFLLNLSSYFSLEGLQSSLNSSTGTLSLSAVYISLVFSSLFLPPVCIKIGGCRKVLAFGTATYTFYTLANFYPRAYTLVPTAIILGAGSSLIWSSARVYVSNLACLCARNEGKDVGKCTGYFLGVFNAVFSCSLFLGPLIASTTFYLSRSEITNSTSSDVATFQPSNASVSAFVGSKCGLHDCDSTLDAEETDTESRPELNGTVFNLLLADYTAMNVIAVLIIVFAMDDVPDSLHNALERDEEIQNQRAEEWPKDETQNAEINDDKSQICDERTEKVKTKTKVLQKSQNKNESSTLMEVIATIKFIMSNHISKLLVLLTIHLGQVQSFALGTFTSSWVKCSRGVDLVGFILAGYGMAAAIAGVSFGYLLRWISRSVIFVIVSIVTVSVSIMLLIWEPTQANDIPLFVFVCCCYGIAYVTYNSVLVASYSLFFENNKAAANAAFMVWYSLGASAFYALGSVMCTSTALYLLITISVIGTVMCLIAEHIFGRTTNSETG